MGAKVEIKITEHAFQRLKERSGLNQSAANRSAHKAYENGLTHSECTGNLFKWVTSTTQTSHKNSQFRVYGDKLWIFVKESQNCVKLVTIIQVPNNLKKITEVLMQKKREVNN